jgi:hypothetical protein
MLKIRKIKLKKAINLDIDTKIDDSSINDANWWMNRDYRYKKREGLVCLSSVKSQKKD